MYWPVKRSVAKRGQAGGTAASISSTNKLPPPQDVSPGRAFWGTSSTDDSPDTSHPALRQTNSWYERATASLVKFWYCDLPPLSGPVRFFYYGFLFFDINWGNNFWASGATYHFRASRCQEKAASLVYYRELGFQMKVDAGFLGHFFAALQDPEEAIPCEAMAFALRLALLCACVGFAGRMPRVVAATIWVVMVALSHAWWGKPPGHSPNLPAVALMSLCFAENNLVDCWSVDSLLARIYRRVTSGTCTGGKQKDSPPWQRGDPSVGGAARKLILVQAVLVMFFAGVHKTATWGIKWLSGSTIGYSIRTQRTRWRWLKKVVLQLPFLPTVMATSSVVGELFSVVALISPRWRPYAVLSWAMFHLGIFLLMNPNFLMQGMTYSLILDWGRILPWIERSSIERGCVLTCNWPSVSIERPKPAKASPRMQVGAWVLSAIALLMFLASFLRIDYFPLASYSLYNWDPSEPGFEKMFTADSVKEAAHRCVTEPPLNPTCLNLGGQGMTHENKFHAAMTGHLSFVTIVGDASIATKGVVPSSSRKCPLKIYHGQHGHQFNPYVCWSLDSNTTSQIGGGEHSLEELMRRLLIDPRHLNKYKDPTKARKPRRLEGEVHSLEAVSSGLGYRTRDAAGSAIAEGGLTCLDDPQDGMSTRMPSPYNSASRYARQIRTRMGPDFIGEDLQILAVGLMLGYGKRPSDKMPSRGCMLGSSVVGELDDDTLGNHEIGATSSTRVDLPRPGLSGWMDVIKGGFIVLAVGFVVLLQSKWQTSRKERHSFATPEEQKGLLHVDLSDV